MIKKAYLDYAATCPTVFWNCVYNENTYNSNAPYAQIEQTNLQEAREGIKKQLRVKTGYVLFTRCATESIEWLAQRMNITCEKGVHDSVYNCRCFKNEQTAFLHCLQLVNPLTGEASNIKDRICFLKDKNNSCSTYYGIDYTAAIGHIELPENVDEYVDAIWFSPHKFGCEKGMGVLWLSNKLFKALGGNIDPKNQYGLIHGTVNVAGAIAVAKAMEVVNHYVNEDIHTWNDYSLYLITELNHNMNAVVIDEYEKEKYGGTPAINLIWLEGINADALQTWLAEKGIYISIAASACAMDNTKYRVTKELGIDNEIARQCIRVSFGVETTIEDIRALINAIVEFKEMF